MVELRAGDKCPQCKQGLLERTDFGLACNTCSFDMEIEEVVASAKRQNLAPTKGYKFKGATLKISIDDPEEGEQFLLGLIVARSNNSSEYFEMLIDGVNTVLEPWRKQRLAAELALRNG